MEVAISIAAVVAALGGFVLFLWRRDTRSDAVKGVEVENHKQTLEDLQLSNDAQRKVRDEFGKILADTPDDWDALRLRQDSVSPNGPH